MAKNDTAHREQHHTGYEDRHTTEYSQEQLQYDNLTPQEAYTAFMGKLEEKHPALAADLSQEHHPLSTDRGLSWLDKDKQDTTVTHLMSSFEEFIYETDNTYPSAKENAAFQVATRLTDPLTYPSRLMADTYADDPDEEADPNTRYYTHVLKTASDLAQSLTSRVAPHLTSHEASNDDITRCLTTMEMNTEAHLDYVAHSLYMAVPQGMDDKHKEEHAKSLPDTLSHPIRDKIAMEHNPTSPFQDYSNHLINEPGTEGYAAQHTAGLAHRLHTLRENNLEQLEQQTNEATENLTLDLSHTDHGFTEIRQALTGIQGVNQKLDYRSTKDHASDLKEAFDNHTYLKDGEYQEEAAAAFITSITWSFQQEIEEITGEDQGHIQYRE